MKFCRNTSKGPYHYRDNFCISQFPQYSDFFFQILVLFHFFFSSFSPTLTSAGTAISIIIPFSFFLITIRSGRLASIRLSHRIFMSYSTLISSFSTAPSGACSYHFSLCSNHSFYKYPKELSFQHCRVVFCIIFEPIFHICLCVAHFHLLSHTICTGGFHWSYRCGTSYSLS